MTIDFGWSDFIPPRAIIILKLMLTLGRQASPGDHFLHCITETDFSLQKRVWPCNRIFKGDCRGHGNVFAGDQNPLLLTPRQSILIAQGDEENELPEVLMGGCSCIHVDMTKGKKLASA